MSAFVDTTDLSSHCSDDEWLDVTTKERMLQKQLDELQGKLDAKDFELTEMSVQVDVLKGHKILLENDKATLQNSLAKEQKRVSECQQELQTSRKESESLQQSIEKAEKNFQEQETSLRKTLEEKSLSIENQKETIQSLTLFLSKAKEAHSQVEKAKNMEIQALAEHVDVLKDQLSAFKVLDSDKTLKIDEYQKQLSQSLSREHVLETKLQTSLSSESNLKEELQSLRSDTGAIAIVAEDLRAKKQDLESKLAVKEQELISTKLELENEQESKSLLNQELDTLQQKSTSRITKLEQAFMLQTRDLEQANTTVQELEEKLQGTAEKLDDTCQKLEISQKHLQQLKEQNMHLALLAEEKEEEQTRLKEHVEQEIKYAREATERRLDELRMILGVRHHDHFKVGYQPPPILKQVMSFV